MSRSDVDRNHKQDRVRRTIVTYNESQPAKSYRIAISARYRTVWSSSGADMEQCTNQVTYRSCLRSYMISTLGRQDHPVRSTCMMTSTTRVSSAASCRAAAAPAGSWLDRVRCRAHATGLLPVRDAALVVPLYNRTDLIVVFGFKSATKTITVIWYNLSIIIITHDNWRRWPGSHCVTKAAATGERDNNGGNLLLLPSLTA